MNSTIEEKKRADQQLLDALSAHELEIHQLISQLQGTAAEVNAYLQQQGIFEQYRQIHLAYVGLSSFKRDRATRNEALKRALFLAWYQEIEPAAFSGLADLPEDAIDAAYLALNRILEKGWLNEELHWMLAHYAQHSWVLLQHTENKIHLVSDWIRAAQKGHMPVPAGSLPAESMSNRGLMGLYFKELGLEKPAIR